MNLLTHPIRLADGKVYGLHYDALAQSEWKWYGLNDYVNDTKEMSIRELRVMFYIGLRRWHPHLTRDDMDELVTMDIVPSLFQHATQSVRRHEAQRYRPNRPRNRSQFKKLLGGNKNENIKRL